MTLIIRQSRIHSYGCYTTRPIRKGTRIVEYDGEYLSWYVGEVKAARGEMAEAIRQLEVPQWPSQANFILVKIGPLHREFVRAMHQRGVLTRDRSNDQGCDGCVRLTIGTRQQMKQAVTAMAEALKEIGWEKTW